MASDDRNTAGAVQAFYERWPFPRRDPAEEPARLVWTPLDFLTAIGERCFEGRDPLPPRSRILVAGCGTGDSAIWLAEQVRARESQVIALDVSATSLEFTRARAEVRGLTNLRYEHASILDLPKLGLGKFDYINCGGVLHHLDDPDAGLAALSRALAPEGVLGIMVYGRYGRAGVDVVRGLAQAMALRKGDPEAAIETTARLIEALPESNLFVRTTDLPKPLDARAFMVDPGALADMFLHPRERSFTVPEIHGWLGRCDLRWRGWAEQRHAYLPRAWVRDPHMLADLEALDPQTQHAVAELLGCTLRKHTFYASAKGAPHQPVALSAKPDPERDVTLVPLWWTPRPKREFLLELRTHGRTRFGQANAAMVLDDAEYVSDVAEAIDGTRTIAEIVATVERLDVYKGRTRTPLIRARVLQIAELLGLANEFFFRHVDAPSPMTPQAMQRRAFGGG